MFGHRQLDVLKTGKLPGPLFFSVNTHRVSQEVLNLYSQTLVFIPGEDIYNRDVCKVMKNQHENPGIGHKLNEIFLKTCKKSTFSTQQGGETQKTINFGDN